MVEAPKPLGSSRGSLKLPALLQPGRAEVRKTTLPTGPGLPPWEPLKATPLKSRKPPVQPPVQRSRSVSKTTVPSSCSPTLTATPFGVEPGFSPGIWTLRFRNGP